MKRFFFVALLLAACQPPPCEQQWGYFVDDAPHYELSNLKVTPSGVVYDDTGQSIDERLLEVSTAEVEACLEKTVDKTSFRVKIPNDWELSCTGEQTLPGDTFESGCLAKGQKQACACRYRARIQCPNVILATPNLKLYKDALVRFVAGSNNPWIDERLAPCAMPHQEE